MDSFPLLFSPLFLSALITRTIFIKSIIEFKLIFIVTTMIESVITIIFIFHHHHHTERNLTRGRLRTDVRSSLKIHYVDISLTRSTLTQSNSGSLDQGIARLPGGRRRALREFLESSRPKQRHRLLYSYPLQAQVSVHLSDSMKERRTMCNSNIMLA